MEWYIVRDREDRSALAWFIAPETTQAEAEEYASGIGRAYVEVFSGTEADMVARLLVKGTR